MESDIPATIKNCFVNTGYNEIEKKNNELITQKVSLIIRKMIIRSGC